MGFQKLKYGPCMASWSFLTNHARVLLCVAHDPGTRLRDLAAMVGVTERSAHDIVSDLVAAGYVVRDKDSRGNEYRIERHLPLRDPISRERTVGEVLDLLVGVNAQRNGHGPVGTQSGGQANPALLPATRSPRSPTKASGQGAQARARIGPRRDTA